MRKAILKNRQGKTAISHKHKKQARRKRRWNETAVIHQGIYYEPGQLEKPFHLLRNGLIGIWLFVEEREFTGLIYCENA